MDKEQDISLDNERDTSRLEAFSDGVIAVAITLLILDIHVPSFDAKTSLLNDEKVLRFHSALPGHVAYLSP